MDLGEKESPVVVEKKARVEMVERERRVSAVVAKPVVQQQQSQEVILKVSGMFFFLKIFCNQTNTNCL